MQQHKTKIAIVLLLVSMASLSLSINSVLASNTNDHQSFLEMIKSRINQVFGKIEEEEKNQDSNETNNNIKEGDQAIPIESSELTWQWVAGGTCDDNGQACQVEATCPAGYGAINCAQCDTNSCTMDRTTLAEIGVSNYRLAIVNGGRACRAQINTNSNPTHASYKVYALCLKGKGIWEGNISTSGERGTPGLIGPPVPAGDNFMESVTCSVASGARHDRNPVYHAQITTEVKKDANGNYYLRSTGKGKVEVASFHTSLTGGGKAITKVINLDCDTGWKNIGKINDWDDVGNTIRRKTVTCYKNENPHGLVIGRINTNYGNNQLSLMASAGFGKKSYWNANPHLGPELNYILNQSTIHCHKFKRINR